jgi:hypothetical protein
MENSLANFMLSSSFTAFHEINSKMWKTVHVACTHTDVFISQFTVLYSSVQSKKKKIYVLFDN